jgi:hypothetical protein
MTVPVHWLKVIEELEDRPTPDGYYREARFARVNQWGELNYEVVLLPDSDPSQARTGDHSDGPFEPFLFRWAGKQLDLSDAPARYRLLAALWDTAAGRPYPSRLVADVVEIVWGNSGTNNPETSDDSGDLTSDSAIRDLCYRTRANLADAGILLNVRNKGGKMWLESV